MSRLLERIDSRDGRRPVLKSTGMALDEIEQRLHDREAPAAIGASTGLDAMDLVAALAFFGLGPDGADGPPLLQSRPSREWLRPALSEAALGELLPDSPRTARLALAAGLLQIHDFWDDSHHAAQEADDLGETAVSAYWHGIAHRREPDFGNASYWFRRVGKHPIFGPLGTAARELIERERTGTIEGDPLAAVPWDPFAFLNACRSGRDGRRLRRLQRLEMALLLDATTDRLA
jgi:hypothetical protein